MSYTPINWQNGDTITAEKMNKMDNGWGIGEVELFSETVTTVSGNMGVSAQLTYSGQLLYPTISVDFDGTTYNVNVNYIGEVTGYGDVGDEDPEFTNYPFFILSQPNNVNIIYTENAGTYSVTVNVEDVVVSNDFEVAVQSCLNTNVFPLRLVPNITTYDEALQAFNSGSILYFFAEENYLNKCFYITHVSRTCSFIPESTSFEAKFGVDGGAFYIDQL